MGLSKTPSLSCLQCYSIIKYCSYLSIKSLLNEALWVDFINDWVSVLSCARCEQVYFSHHAQLSQKLVEVGSFVYVHGSFHLFHLDFNIFVFVLGARLFKGRVHQGQIQIQNYDKVSPLIALGGFK